MGVVTIPALLLAIPFVWLLFVMLYASVKVFKWLRKWNP
jgi:hypothetical protein